MFGIFTYLQHLSLNEFHKIMVKLLTKIILKCLQYYSVEILSKRSENFTSPITEKTCYQQKFQALEFLKMDFIPPSLIRTLLFIGHFLRYRGCPVWRGFTVH